MAPEVSLQKTDEHTSGNCDPTGYCAYCDPFYPEKLKGLAFLILVALKYMYI